MKINIISDGVFKRPTITEDSSVKKIQVFDNKEIYNLLECGNLKCFEYKYGNIFESIEKLTFIKNNIPKYLFINYIIMIIDNEKYIMDDIFYNIARITDSQELFKLSLKFLENPDESKLHYTTLSLIALGYGVDNVLHIMDDLKISDIKSKSLNSFINELEIRLSLNILKLSHIHCDICDGLICKYIKELVKFLSSESGVCIKDIDSDIISDYGIIYIMNAVSLLMSNSLDLKRVINKFGEDDFIELLITYRFDQNTIKRLI